MLLGPNKKFTFSHHHFIRSETVSGARNLIKKPREGSSFLFGKDLQCETSHGSLHFPRGFAIATSKEINIRSIGFGAWVEIPYYSLPFSAVELREGPGRLSYIDGCSNTLAIAPQRSGDPCVNLLFFPQHREQSYHSHPSLRLGLVLQGQGTADVADGPEEKQYDLKEGVFFALDPHVRHRFRTRSETMSVIVFHPDSEDGPRDEANPMRSRTYL